MKKILLFLSIITLFSSCNDIEVEKGDKRIYCEHCGDEINPYENNGVEVTIIDVSSNHVQYVDEEGDTTSLSVEHFDEFTYVNGENVAINNDSNGLLLYLIIVWIAIFIIVIL